MCLNSGIRSLINKNLYNIKIFELLVSDAHSFLLVNESHANLRETFVQFITRSVLGSSNERMLAEMLKETLTRNVIDINKHFVGQIFLPILNSFSKSLVCLLPFDSKENKIVVDPSSVSLPSREDRITHTKAPKFRLPSNIISEGSKEEFFSMLASQCGVTGGNFNLAVSHMSDAVGLCEKIESSLLESTQSLLFLFRLRALSGGKDEVLGIFYQ